MNNVLDAIPTIVTVIAVDVLLPFAIVFLLSWWIEGVHRKAWKKFAVANKLRFPPDGSPMGGTPIEGAYRGHGLEITAHGESNSFWESRSFSTRVKLKPHFPGPEQSAGMAWDIAASPTPEEVLNLLAPNGLHGVGKGKIEVMPRGERLLYRQGGVLTDVDKMQRVCSLLADLADHYPAVMSIGGMAVPSLQIIGWQRGMLPSVARQMLRDIAHDTQKRLGPQAEHLLCPRCLMRCGAHRASLPWQFDMTYYGCRLCRQSREFIDCPQGVVAVLDSGSTDAQAQADGLLRVNWLARRALFDFDRVEIIRAADEDVERFAVQVGNDSDPLRRPRYAEMGCAVSPACGLSENTLRVLESTFGQVQRSAI